MSTPAVVTPSRRHAPLVVERIADAPTFTGLRDEWNELVSSSGADTLFLTWEWLHSWWRHLADARRLALVTVRRDGRLLALAPLAVRPPSLSRLQPIPALEFLGTGTAGSDYLDVIVRRGEEGEAVAALAEHLAVRTPMLELSHVHSGASVAADLAARLGGHGWTSATSTVNVCPFIPLSGHTWASYLDSLGSAHRYNVQRRIRNLDKQFDVRFERAHTEDERRAALALLVELHNRRWDPRGGSESFATPALLAFYDEVSRLALARGWLRLYVLRLDGRAVAALHGYAYGGAFLFYQAGFDPDFAKQSVGLVTMGLAIKSAIEEGLNEYDLLHGDESYKFQWAPKSRELARIQAFPGSLGGRLGRRAMGASRALRQRARGLLGNRVADRLTAALRSGG